VPYARIATASTVAAIAIAMRLAPQRRSRMARRYRNRTETHKTILAIELQEKLAGTSSRPIVRSPGP
jgi:hypothetical protein